MPREYRHIKEYEKELLNLKAQGLTLKEIGERLDFSREQVKGFLNEKEKPNANLLLVLL